MIQTAQRLDGIGEYYFSKKLREIDELNKAGKNIINLGIGSPDQPPHPDVIATLQEESAKPNTHAYQNYKGSPVLRSAFSQWYQQYYGVTLNPETEILPLIGSKEGIMHICMTYLNNGDKVLVPNPGYPTYSSAVKLAGGTTVPYELLEVNNYEPVLEEIDTTGVKLMFVNYPHMPTGQLPTDAFFEKLVAWAKERDILVIHDNPYSFILNNHPKSLLSVKGAKDIVLELNSLSKSHNMAGWRIGALVGHADRLNEVIRFKSNMDSGMFLPAQLAAAKALLLPREWYDSVNFIYKNRQKKVFALLDLLNCTFSRQQAGMFVWASANNNSTLSNNHELGAGGFLSDEVLYKANVFITPGGIFGSAGNNYIRVSLCATEEKIDEAIKRIKENL